VLTNSFPSSSRWVVSSNLSSMGHCSVSGVSSSCPSTAATTWYFFLRRATTTTTAISPPDGGGIDDVFPHGGRASSGFVPSPSPPQEEEAGQPWPSRRQHLIGCRASDDTGAPAGDTSCVDLASETKTSVVSPQHANPKRTDDASTFAKDLLGVSLVPEITVQSVPDATSSPSVDQEVPSVFHHVPFRFSFDPPSDLASVDAFTKAYPNLPGYHTWSTWDRLTAVSTYRPPGSEEDDEPDSGWDFSGLSNPSAMRDFMTACDYCLSDYSDGSHSLDDEDCGPSRECFHVDLGGLDEGNHLGMPEDDDPPRPAPRVDILRELAVVLVPMGGQDTQLEQIREMQAKLDEEAGQLVQLRQNIGQEWAGRAPAGETRHLAQDVQHRIANDARARLPPTSSGVGQNLAAAAILLRAMPEPSTTEGRRIQGELKNLLEDAAVRRAESSASRRQGYPPEHRVVTSRFMREASVHTGRTRDATPATLGRLGNEHHRHDRRAHLDEKVR
jgi:hypothetical protein